MDFFGNSWYNSAMKKTAFVLLLIFLGFSFFVYAESKATVLLFSNPHCHMCFKVKTEILPEFKEKYKEKVDWVDLATTDPDNLKILQSYADQYERGKAQVPTVVVGGEMLLGFAEIEQGLDRAIQKALLSQIETVQLPQRDLVDIFKKFSLLAILGSGLADGINPCAFTVIVFFISFLAVYGYNKREIIYVGSAYCLAVFITYLLIGLGFFEIFYSLGSIASFIKWFYYLVIFFCFFMGGFAIYDYIHFKITKKSEGAILQLPAVLKRRINLTIGSKLRKKQNGSLWGLAAASFSVGFIVSLLEAACTGQLYLPTIVFVLKTNQFRLKSWTYLLLYNLMFILPLVVVFLLSLMGVSSEKFNNFLKRNVGIIKLIMAFVFFALGGFILMIN